MKSLVLALSIAAGVAHAGLLTFDLGPGQPVTAVNGQTIGGVTFDFSILAGSCSNPYAVACYGQAIGSGVLGLAPLSDPVLDGPASGILTLSFSQPVDFLSFDFVLGVNSAQPAGVSVALSGAGYNGPGILTGGSIPQGLALLSVGSFYYSGSTFDQAVISFASAAGSSLFAIDNVEFDHVPEPGSWFLTGSGILLLGGWRLRKRRG